MFTGSGRRVGKFSRRQNGRELGRDFRSVFRFDIDQVVAVFEWCF